MQARDVFLAQLMQGPRQFIIPIFQRTYSWTQSNCDQLLKDIKHVGESSLLQSHFVGSLVLIQSPQSSASIPQWLVIDGQQRLTTVTLLIVALLDKATELGLKTISATPLEGIREYFLANQYAEGDLRYKLFLTKGDKESLFHLVNGKKSDQIAETNINTNYEFFFNSLKSVAAIEAIYQGLMKLKVVEVTLTAGTDDPQAIFESLNSTGLDLSQADLIRNYVLMGQEHALQKSLYEDLWYPMEQAFGRTYGDKFDRFVQDFLTLKLQANALIKSRDIYPNFKHWFQKSISTTDVNSILQELCQYARYYCAFSLGKEIDQDLNKAFKDLRTLVEVATPTVIRLYHLYKNAKLKKEEFVIAVRLLESYVLRRSICDMQTRSLGNTFAMLSQKITDEAPLESLKVALVRFNKNSRFPSNNEFKEALTNRDLYESRNCRFVLEKLENDSKEEIRTSNFSIEHVMPQNPNLKEEWRQMLGDNWKEVQEIWLHRLGNLTLTGYNSEYQDKPFLQKKAMEGGFDDSPLRLNKLMRDSEVWTENEMRSRGKMLAEKALRLWPKPEVEETTLAKYVLEEKKRAAKNLSVADLSGLKADTLELLDLFDLAIKQVDPEISVIYSARNVTYWSLSPVAQLVPRKGYLAIIFALDFDDIDLPKLRDHCQRTSDWSFVTNADLEGVYCQFCKRDDIEWLKPLLELAYSFALS